MSIEEIEQLLGSQAPHHWFSAESFPSVKDYYKIKEVLSLDESYEEELTKVHVKSSEKKNVVEYGRNKRCVWDITTKPSSLKHFAMYPEELVETPLRACCPEFVCNRCGKAREKILIKKEYLGEEKEASKKFQDSNVNSAGGRKHYLSEQRKYPVNQEKVASLIKIYAKGKEQKLDEEFGNTTWSHWVRTDKSGASLPSPEQYKKIKELLSLPSDYDEEMLTTVKTLVDDKGKKEEFSGYSNCGCNEGFSGGVVLDPFFGAGTTGIVALKQGKKFIGVELNKSYCEIAEKRIKPYLEQEKLKL